MLLLDQPLEARLPELPYGAVWLVGCGDRDQRHLSPLAVHALSTADAVIHDPGIPREILDLAKPPRYREVASLARALERSMKLAEDGWRVVQLVNDDVMERAVKSAVRCAERNIPFRIAPTAGEPFCNEAPLGLLLVRRTVAVGGTDPRPTLVLVIATPQSDPPAGTVRRLRPLDFSMSGLAG